MSKHAYLIMAHDHFDVLENLIVLLDDWRNDIYLHVDKKVIDFDPDHFRKLVHKSTLYFAHERVHVYWGHVSLIRCEMVLFRQAYEQDEAYAYYHLLSGVDLPLKSQDYIHDFFAKHQGKEFIGFVSAYWDRRKVTRIHLFPKKFRYKQKQINSVIRTVRSCFLFLQDIYYRYCPVENDYTYQKGAEWVSLTHACVGFLLKYEKEYYQRYKNACASDEVYKQTALFNSAFYANVFDQKDEYRSCMRLIDWQRGTPYVFSGDDINELLQSDRLFARKVIDKKTWDYFVNLLKV